MTCIALKSHDFGSLFRSPSVSRPWRFENFSTEDTGTFAVSATESIGEVEPDMLRKEFCSRLLEVIDEAAERAEPDQTIDLHAAEMAIRVVQSIPLDIPSPDPSVASTGEIALDWRGGRGRYFSILLKSDDKIAFAAYDRGERMFGSAEYYSDAIPGEISRQLLRWHTR